MNRDATVLVLYNVPHQASTGSDACQWLESDAGVLNEVESVENALDVLGIAHRRAGIQTLSDLHRVLGASAETVIFNLVEGLTGKVSDYALVPAMCRTYGKECTGGDTPGLLLAQDKWRANLLLRGANVSCPRAVLVPIGEEVSPTALSAGPHIVKPVFTDASEGIDPSSVIDADPVALNSAVRRIHEEFKQPALVECFVGQRELNISVLERNGRVEVLPVAEIDYSAFDHSRPRLVGYSAKWKPDSFEFNNTPRILPARLTASEVEEVRATALAAWNAIGCRDYARVDMRLDSQSKVFVLEVNPNPDISPDAGFSAALAAEGVGYEAFVEAMVANALSRIRTDICDDRVKPIPVRPVSCEARIRETRAEDIEGILAFLESTGRFRPCEIDVAREVLDDAMGTEREGVYHCLTAEGDGKPVGWICFGPTPCTEGTCDIDWLAVDPEWQKKGIASALVIQAEAAIVALSCRMIVVETSSREDYGAARSFYVKHGYGLISRIPEFYASSDDMMVYVKYMQSGENVAKIDSAPGMTLLH